MGSHQGIILSVAFFTLRLSIRSFIEPGDEHLCDYDGKPFRFIGAYKPKPSQCERPCGTHWQLTTTSTSLTNCLEEFSPRCRKNLPCLACPIVDFCLVLFDVIVLLLPEELECFFQRWAEYLVIEGGAPYRSDLTCSLLWASRVL